jgi:hypothetical protein
MALRRKTAKGAWNGLPVKCSFCKEIKAYHTVHGIGQYGGWYCCDTCFKKLQEAERNKTKTDETDSEAENSLYNKYGV